MDDDGCMFLFCVLSLGFVVGVWMGSVIIPARQADNLRREAVERGHAEWVTDTSGITTWQWKEARDAN